MTQMDIFSRYGSGYPGVNGVGVGGRNFPFFFWPVVYSAIAGDTAEQAYLYDTEVSVITYTYTVI